MKTRKIETKKNFSEAKGERGTYENQHEDKMSDSEEETGYRAHRKSRQGYTH